MRRNAMLYREMPKTGDKLSILGFGCMRLPGSAARVNEEEAIRQIRYAVDQGVNYLDTAWPYHNGNSEVVLGKALKDGYRERVKVADKLPHWLCEKREDMDYYLDEQLKRLDLEQIDYYLIHMLDGGTWRKALDMGVVDFMDRAKASGKIAHIGFSFHGPREDFKTVVDGYDWEFCQIQYNILDEHAQAGIEGLVYARSKDIGVIIMEPLRGGALAGKLPKEVEAVYRKADADRSNADWALRWIWNHPGIITVLSGMNSMDQIDENLKIASEADIHSMSTVETDTVSTAAETFRNLMKVPCTGCQYCMPCPKGVNIPSAFTFYNQKYLFKQGFMSRAMYLLQHGTIQGREPSLASQCVACGLCMKHCPQSIQIPSELKTVEREFEGFFTKPINFMIRAGLSAGRRKE
jgi:predicted aldo/keto reductase-like oxidoreductase